MIKRQPAPKAIYRVVEVCIDDIPEEASLEYEPYNILQRKIETLCAITGCTEREAQRMVLEML